MATNFLTRLLRPSPAKVAGEALYHASVAQARRPALYRDMGVPDTPEGRFELYSLHVALLLLRLKGQGPAASQTSQALFDIYVSDLDNALREMGVGDLSVGRKMRKLGEAFYGRVKSYEAALAAMPDTTALQALLARTVYAETEDADPDALCAYAASAHADLRGQETSSLAAGTVTWPNL